MAPVILSEAKDPGIFEMALNELRRSFASLRMTVP